MNRSLLIDINNLFCSACGDPIELCSLLTAAMGDRMVDEPDSGGQTPLHLAAAQGATICCMHLLQVKGAAEYLPVILIVT